MESQSTTPALQDKGLYALALAFVAVIADALGKKYGIPISPELLAGFLVTVLGYIGFHKVKSGRIAAEEIRAEGEKNRTAIQAAALAAPAAATELLRQMIAAQLASQAKPVPADPPKPAGVVPVFIALVAAAALVLAPSAALAQERVKAGDPAPHAGVLLTDEQQAATLAGWQGCRDENAKLSADLKTRPDETTPPAKLSAGLIVAGGVVLAVLSFFGGWKAAEARR